jgi:hypothetical protein
VIDAPKAAEDVLGSAGCLRAHPAPRAFREDRDPEAREYSDEPAHYSYSSRQHSIVGRMALRTRS